MRGRKASAPKRIPRARGSSPLQDVKGQCLKIQQVKVQRRFANPVYGPHQYFTPQPYGGVLGVETVLPAFDSSIACFT